MPSDKLPRAIAIDEGFGNWHIMPYSRNMFLPHLDVF